MSSLPTMNTVKDFLNEALNTPVLLLHLHIIVSALFPIYTGAHASLSRPASAGKPLKEHEHTLEDEDEEEETVQIMEGLSASDAIVFPVTAGLLLATLYWLIKRYGADVINLIMAWYFAGASILSVTKLFSDGINLCLSFVFPSYYEDNGKLFHVRGKVRRASPQGVTEQTLSRSSPLPGWFGRFHLSRTVEDSLWNVRSSLQQKYTLEAYIKALLDLKSNFTVVDFTALLIGLGTVAYNNFVSKPWWLTNIQGFAVSYFALQFISPTSFLIGSLVLSGLFFYDIWAVFFTPLMVTVATNLDQPIKLLFPRPDAEPNKSAYSMLGLGDIVLPGLMVGLALRFDLFLYYKKKQKSITTEEKQNPSTTEEKQDPTTTKDSQPAGEVHKAPYTPARGQQGSQFWTSNISKCDLPPVLQNAAFPKPYFRAAVFGYLIGMTITLLVMTIFQAAQPALLYLVPSVLLSLWGTAFVRGELKAMRAYTEELTTETLQEVVKEESNQSKDEDASRRSWWDFAKGLLFKDDGPQKDGEDVDQSNKPTVASIKHQTAAAGDPEAVVNISVKRYTAVSEQKGTQAEGAPK